MVRGIAYAKKRDYDRAIQDCDQGIRLKPDDPGAFISRGIAYARKRDYDRAIQDFTEALRLKPNFTEAAAWRADAERLRNEAN